MEEAELSEPHGATQLTTDQVEFIEHVQERLRALALSVAPAEWRIQVCLQVDRILNILEGMDPHEATERMQRVANRELIDAWDSIQYLLDRELPPAEEGVVSAAAFLRESTRKHAEELRRQVEAADDE